MSNAAINSPLARGKYVTAHAEIVSGQAAYENGWRGLAVKQLTAPRDTPRADKDKIEEGERYYLLTLGEVRVPIPEGAELEVGDWLYLNRTTNALTVTPSAATVAFGKVCELPPFRGLPAGECTVDLDAKPEPLSAAKTWDPGSAADGAAASTTVTVAGAAIGDHVTAGFSLAVPAGVVLSAAVTAADTVTVTVGNLSGGAVDLGEGTLTVTVRKVGV